MLYDPCEAVPKYIDVNFTCVDKGEINLEQLLILKHLILTEQAAATRGVL